MMSAYAHQRDHGSVLKLHAAMDGIGIVLDYYSFLAVWTNSSDTGLFVEKER